MAVSALAAPASVLAADNPFIKAQNDIGKISGAAQLGSSATPLTTIIGNIINIVLGFMGIILLFYILYAGFLWMTAGGDDKNVTKAKDMLKNAIIGLVLILAAVAISNFVIGSLVNVTQSTS
ncbi:MAG TPA: hypothetical protein VFQ60_04985 [Patescibacteria group bacterium]|nr:hypothetical protein [Patescibacteria group bacterium]